MKLGEYSTVGGLLCAIAGMIPKAGDQVEFAGFAFTVLEVEDNRRISSLIASPIVNKINSSSKDGNTSQIYIDYILETTSEKTENKVENLNLDNYNKFELKSDDNNNNNNNNDNSKNGEIFENNSSDVVEQVVPTVGDVIPFAKLTESNSRIL